MTATAQCNFCSREDFLFMKCTQKINARVSLFYLHRWVDFSPVTYTHWGPGEPNNANGEEQCVQMNRNQGNEIPFIGQLRPHTVDLFSYCACLLNSYLLLEIFTMNSGLLRWMERCQLRSGWSRLRL